MIDADKGLSSSDDVFDHFKGEFGLDGDGDISAIALFSYALVEKDRIDWAEHRLAITASAPSAIEVQQWFLAKPRSYLDDKGDHAARWFAAFARGLLRDEIEAEKAKAVTAALGDLRKFWPGFWIGNLVGLTSNLVFTLIVVLFVLFVSSDFSFIAWTKKIFSLH